MTDETMQRLREVEEESSGNVADLGDVFDGNEKHQILGLIGDAQKLEHDERKLRLEEEKQKLESEKFEYQKKQNASDRFWSRLKVVGEVAAGVGTLTLACVKGVQVIIQRKAIKEAYNIEQVGSIASPTARMLLKDSTNPRV